MKSSNLGKILAATVLIGGMMAAVHVWAESQQDSYGMMPGSGHDHERGMRAGMMGGYAMGHNMRGNYGSGRDLNLSKEQRDKIDKIHGELRRKHWDVMGKMREEEVLMKAQYDAEPRDDAALSKSFRKISDLRQEMFDLSLASRHQIDEILSKEQREKSRRD